MTEPETRVTATAAWVDGQPDPGGLSGRLRLAWDSIAGGGRPSVLVAVALYPGLQLSAEQREATQRVLRDFLHAQAPLLTAAAAATAR